MVDNIGATQENSEQRDGGDNLEGDADSNSTSTVYPSATLGLVDSEPGPLEQQQAAGGDEACSAIGDGTSSSTLATATGTGSGHQKDARRGELLTGGLAVAVSGHWRAAEQQFEGTARRVRSKF